MAPTEQNSLLAPGGARGRSGSIVINVSCNLALLKTNWLEIVKIPAGTTRDGNSVIDVGPTRNPGSGPSPFARRQYHNSQVPCNKTYNLHRPDQRGEQLVARTTGLVLHKMSEQRNKSGRK